MKRKERIVYLDAVRVLACLMVVLMHSPMPNAGANAYVLSSVSLLTAPGIGLFFMVSGALLLPVEVPLIEFVKRRMGKVLFPTLFWTFFYIIVANVSGGGRSYAWAIVETNSFHTVFCSGT